MKSKTIRITVRLELLIVNPYENDGLFGSRPLKSMTCGIEGFPYGRSFLGGGGSFPWVKFLPQAMCDALKAEKHQAESPESFRDRMLQVQEEFPEHLGVLEKHRWLVSVFKFSHPTWGNDQFWPANFQRGWINHQQSLGDILSDGFLVMFSSCSMVWVWGKWLVSCYVFKVINWFVVVEIGVFLEDHPRTCNLYVVH